MICFSKYCAEDVIPKSERRNKENVYKKLNLHLNDQNIFFIVFFYAYYVLKTIMRKQTATVVNICAVKYSSARLHASQSSSCIFAICDTISVVSF